MQKANGSNKNLLTIIAVVLALSSAGTVLLQIYYANQQTTKLETTLFSVLQFVFSLGFAWILSRVEAKREFVESQRKFAIAAYRRINEIDGGVERVINRAKNQFKFVSKETAIELDVILAIATGVRCSIKSSIADWGDVIGEEIITMEKIEQLNDEQHFLHPNENEESPSLLEELANEPIADEIPSEKENILNKLRETLPYSLQIITQKGLSRSNTTRSIISSLEIEMLENGYIDLKGFWDKSFQRDIWTFELEQNLQISIGAAGNRGNALIAKDDAGNTVGVITNLSDGSYDLFKRAFMKFMNKKEIKAEIISISKKEDHGGRHYFKVRVYEAEKNYLI